MCLEVASLCVMEGGGHSDFPLSEVRNPFAPELHSQSESQSVGELSEQRMDGLLFHWKED